MQNLIGILPEKYIYICPGTFCTTQCSTTTRTHIKEPLQVQLHSLEHSIRVTTSIGVQPLRSVNLLLL